MYPLHRAFDSPTLQNMRRIPLPFSERRKKTKQRIVAVLFAITVLSMGCSGEGVFENPDSIRVTTLEAIHGRQGHRVDFNIGPNKELGSKDVGMTKQAVLELRDAEVTTATIYLVIKTNSIGIGRAIDVLKSATEVAIVPTLPKNTEPWTRMVLTFGGAGGDPFAGYLRITAPTETAFISLRGTVTQEKREWFLREVRKPPKVLDTLPATITEISYYSDDALTMPLVDTILAGDTVYTKVVFSKSVPITFADSGPSQPSIASEIASQVQYSVRFPIEFQYRMQPGGTILQSGEAKPYQGSDSIFICRYDVKRDDLSGLFRTIAGYQEASGSPLRVALFRHTGQPPANTGETITNWQPNDFVGQVYTIDSYEAAIGRSLDRGMKVPVAGVTVTIVAGHRAGESTVTDKNGRYRFLSVAQDKLHLRTERKHFETKEVLVHRSRPTILSDGSVPNYNKDPQKEPGNILIGQVWPEGVRILLKEVLLVHDLLYIDVGTPPENQVTRFTGAYGNGIILIFGEVFYTKPDPIKWALRIFSHEIAHAHQHAVALANGGQSTQDWANTPEGVAYAEARRQDVEVLGIITYYDTPATHFNTSLLENAAEHCANYWGTKRGEESGYRALSQVGKTLEELAPNRYKWAEEWLKKK